MALSPPLWPQLLSYGGYRLECALRSATLLGVFGLGGIGADLRLALQSLQFHEVWTSLWLLAAVMLALELVLARLRQRWPEPNRELLVGFAALLLLLLPASQWLELRWQVLFSPWQWPEVLPLWDPSGWLQDWPQLIGSTLLLTALAALLAVALLPLLLLLLGPGRWPRLLLSACGLLARLLPPPLTALLLLFVLQPGLLPAVLALGLHNAGILGRLGLEGCCDWLAAVRGRRLTAAASASAAIGWRQSAAGVAGGWLQRHRPQLFEFRGLPRRCDPARERGGGPGGRWRFGGGAAGVVEFVCLGRGVAGLGGLRRPWMRCPSLCMGVPPDGSACADALSGRRGWTPCGRGIGVFVDTLVGEQLADLVSPPFAQQAACRYLRVERCLISPIAASS